MSDLTKWAKVIDTPEGQILFYQEYDADLDRDEIYVVYQNPQTDLRLSLSMSRKPAFTQEEFDKFATKENAITYVRIFQNE